MVERAPIKHGGIVGADVLVALADGRRRAYINLDNAASTPPIQSVLEAVLAFLPHYSSVHRGTGFKSRLSTEAYDRAREIVGRFVGADPNEHVVIFGKNTTEGLNTLAQRLDLGRQDVVIISGLEHHSNDLPWRSRSNVKHIDLTPEGEIDTAHLEELLVRYAGRVRLVAVSGASNVTGYMPDLGAIARLTHAAGAQIAVDAAQLAPHRQITMGRLDDADHLDYVAVSAHKLYAPFGSGALIGRRDTFAHGAPAQVGGGTVTFVTRTTVGWAPTPERDEAGSPNVVGAVAFAAAAQAVERIGWGRLARHETMLTAYALRVMRSVPGLRVFGDADPARATSRIGVIPFSMEGVPHALVASVLSHEYGIGVRNGCFCAHPYIAHLLGLSSEQIQDVRRRLAAGSKVDIPGLVRVSFGLYNTVNEIDELILGLRNIAAGKMAHYTQDRVTGEFHAT